MALRNQLASNTSEKVSENEDSKSKEFFLPHEAVLQENICTLMIERLGKENKPG